MSDTSGLEDTILDIKALLKQYPKLAPLVSVFVLLLGMATITKTLVEGFEWAHKWGKSWGGPEGGTWGVLLVVGGSAILIYAVLLLIKWALRPRPNIEYFESPYLSRNPTLRWAYDEPKNKKVTYEVIVQRPDGTPVEIFKAPQFMRHRVLKGIYGQVKIRVDAMSDGKCIRSSGFINAEIYFNAKHRIIETGKLRVAVHEDPGEEVFCYYPKDKWVGFDIDFSELIAEKLTKEFNLKKRIKVEYRFYTWPEVIGSPNKYEVDMAIASISINEKREKKYNIIFSEPYEESCLGIVAKDVNFGSNTSDIIELHELVGKKVVVHNETTASELAELMEKDEQYKGKIEFVVAKNNDELREWLKNNDVHMAMYGYLRGYTMLEDGMSVKRLKHSYPIELDKSGVVFPNISVKLRDIINKIISDNKSELSNILKQKIQSQRDKKQKDAAADI